MSLIKDDVFGYSSNGLYGHPYHELILEWFDPLGYLELNPDLHVVVKQKYDYEALLFHFVNAGFFERRIYCPRLLRSFNADYYRNFLNDEVKSFSDERLMRHWIYEGVFKGYATSEDTDAGLRSPFQIFNIGRVGSLSIVDALLKCGYTNVIHTHSDYEFSRANPCSCLTFSQLMEIKAKQDTRPPMFIISGVRDPISWLISSYSRLIDIESHADDLAALQLPGFEGVLRGRIHFMLNFFKNPMFAGFNVFGNGFNTEEGYGLYKFGKHRLLIYRVDRLSKIECVIADVVGNRNFKIEHINRSSGTARRESIDVFSKILKTTFDDSLIEVLRKSDYMQHFFTKLEQCRLYAQLPTASRRLIDF